MKFLRGLSIVFVFLILLIHGSAMAQQARPTLNSRFSCGCLNSKEEPADFDVSLASSVEKVADGFVYKYEFSNRSSREVKLLMLLSRGNHVSFVGEFITDTTKPPDYRVGRGTIYIVLKSQETKVFTVKDNTPNVAETFLQVALIDKYDSAYAGNGVNIWFPQWEHIFGK